MKYYDLIIIGAGPAGLMVAKALLNKGLKILIIEKGKDLTHRKDLIFGWFGSALYSMDRIEFQDPLLNNNRAFADAVQFIQRFLGKFPVKKSLYGIFSPNAGAVVAARMYKMFEKKVDIVFNAEVETIEREGTEFIITSTKKQYKTKKCVIATGKTSFEWIKSMAENLQLETLEKSFEIGVRIELPISKVKEEVMEGLTDVHLNTFIGEWENSGLLSASSYSRLDANSGKMSFAIKTKTSSTEETIRIVKIINVLSNDKVKIERVIEYVEGHSVLQYLEIFNILENSFDCLNKQIPALFNCGVLYSPEVIPRGVLSVNEDMKTQQDGIYAVGECTDHASTVLGAMASGLLAGRAILKE